MWHVSVSLQRRRQRVVVPDVLETWAVRALLEVGGDWERWRISDAGIGHLHVPVTAAELVLVPAGTVTTDAGLVGPERPRSRR